ncbi:hypothetical protein WHR41_05702 [Cladosporium halotolerans]|uniref:Alkyl hydroperoxide reductase subunit C/ Thiol specific antioxidant domain-containing protein n=1 Tax=Cladosporium halotolerans TaxID=1052096 RepID=A0AB34KMI6_9PEZI
MTFLQELSSWFAPRSADPVPEPPKPGDPAPTTSTIQLSGSPTILTFLRHCGCPFAEKTFLNLRETARAHRSTTFLAISHSSPAATSAWLAALPQAGSEPDNLHVLVDEACEAYAAWGLGVVGFGHVLSVGGLGSVWRLGREEGIWNRPTESGSRWQRAGSFGVDGEGVVRWARPARGAEEIVDFEEGVGVVLGKGGEAEERA